MSVSLSLKISLKFDKQFNYFTGKHIFYCFIYLEGKFNFRI